ncbi:MAG: capsular polysaccharide synthesis protein [Candidatus Wenzhouxiangella sp. M2_3B_020]
MPFDHPFNRYLLRRFVVSREATDRRHRCRMGMSTFPRDWRNLPRHSGAGFPNPTVWMLWLQGFAEAPPLVRMCMESWRVLNPGWNVVFLDASSVREHVAWPELPRSLSRSHIADLLRLRLLYEYGGVWADATTLCLKPLDRWLHRATASGFFAFAQPQPVRSLANWFLASKSESPLVQAWTRWSENYVLSGDPQSYFWMHHTFDWLLRRDREVRRVWRCTPRLSARGPHVIQRILDGHLNDDERPSAEQMQMLPMLKLSWKKGYSVAAIHDVLRAHGIPDPGGA